MATDLHAAGVCRPRGLRERKKAQTREAIIDAAIELFERQGFDATTVDDIVAAADISPRTFFRYFQSKFDVVLARNKVEDATFEQLLAARPADEGPLEALRQVAHTELVPLLGGDDHGALRELKVVMTTPSLRSLAREHFHEHQAEIVQGFAARLGVDEAELQVHVLAGAAANTLFTVFERWLAEGGEPDRLLPMVDEAFDLLAAGLR